MKKPSAFDALVVYERYINSCKDYWPLAKTIKLIIRYRKAYPNYPEYVHHLRLLRYDRLKNLDPDYAETITEEVKK